MTCKPIDTPKLTPELLVNFLMAPTSKPMPFKPNLPDIDVAKASVHAYVNFDEIA